MVESDARALIERFGDDAYREARLRQHESDTDLAAIAGSFNPILLTSATADALVE